ncbi:MAG: 16S rRNA (adenine(1518)-N(6)/adenine(1519)-N(6))-dimethyltransferase RsmA [Candidatus Peribacteraceae bacterium]|nr:16S rRNA (adenine(1518)-N(6)/adenine(1519)-N(6))-dimethyltransferase RsmA [Candidatus Peribacteraceae bacterium]
MDLSQRVRHFCSAHSLKLNTDLGQHFLIDAAILDAIIEAANICSDDTIVEIGPGIGILTEQLLKKAARVTSIELDERLVPLLNAFIDERSKLTVIRGNALHVPFPQTPFKIVANIPYHITSPLLRHAFLESPLPPLSLTLLIQREVAEKICDKKAAGLLTILVRLFGTPRLVRFVPPEAFLPPPQVKSAVLHIDCFSSPLTDRKTMEQVFRLTKIGFSQKRKMLSNTIGMFHGGMERLEALGIDPKRRPQTLSVHEWIRLAQVWDKNGDDGTS